MIGVRDIASMVLSGSLVMQSAMIAMAEDPTREQLDFFEAKIRPVLVEHCYACHSQAAGSAEGDLLLDSRDGPRTGGGSGPAIVPGEPNQSLLLKAVRYDDETLQMPPPDEGGKLPEEVIADLVTWVRLGAPDPRSTVTVAPAKDWDAASQHWAFQPVSKPNVPREGELPVDAFVKEKLELKGLALNPPADKRTLLRRVYYDLTGLPPSYTAMQAFLADKAPDAYTRAVERLLDSPTYGQRWGRHWLDVARYADTRGYRTGGKQERYSFSHAYRDYVIQAFNDDKPFKQFVVEQIAADYLELGTDKSALAAMGFLTLGRRFIDNANLIIDDRIDVVTRGFMGLTVSCARCHDHKFDPIPTADYYSLHGVFASSEEPAELPLLRELDDSPAYRSYLSAKQKLEDDIERIKNEKVDAFLSKHRAKTGDYLLAAHDAESLDPKVTLEEFAGKRDVDVRLLRRWVDWLRKNPSHPVLASWRRVAHPKDALDDGDPSLAAEFDERNPTSLEAAAEIYNELCRLAAKQGTEHVPLHGFLHGDDCPSNPRRDEVAGWLRRLISTATAGQKRDIEALNWSHDGAPPRAPILVDRDRPRNSRIFKRGDARNLGDEVPRQFPRVLAGADRKPFERGSGRWELAQAIANERNPLTARVFVNRVWGWHFGEPLVDTTSDFGIRTPKPIHAELLDWLAATFMENHWSVKELHRQIVHSETYRQSSHVRAKGFAVDPENRLLHHANRRRLDFESMRDTLLAVSGTLDPKLGGISIDVTKHPAPPRRTVYAFVDRQNLPGLLRTFDYPNPDATSPGRFSTTVPQQALFMLNGPFVIDQARTLASSLSETMTDSQRVRQLYRSVLARDPDEAELGLARDFVSRKDSEQGDELSVWEVLAQTLLLSNELMFVD